MFNEDTMEFLISKQEAVVFSYESIICEDRPITATIELISHFNSLRRYKVYIISPISVKDREVLESHLSQNSVGYEQLYLRKASDDDLCHSEVKKKLMSKVLEESDVAMAFDVDTLTLQNFAALGVKANLKLSHY